MHIANADVVVIGAGVRGTSIAYHLAKAGVQAIVVDKGFICSGTSGATFALTSVLGNVPVEYTALSLASVELYPGLAEELGCDLEYERGNQVFEIVEDEADLPAAERYVRRLCEVPGILAQLLTPLEVRELEPNVAPTIAGGIICHQDGHLDPFRLTFGYAAAATRLGATFLPYHHVTSITVAGGRVREVVTDQGTIGCHCVVNAAGIGAAEIGRMVGVEIPVVPCRGQVVTTEPLPGLINQPLGSLKPNKAGPILIGSVYEFVGLDPTPELETMVEKVQRAIRIVPALGRAKMVRCWTGFRPWSIDGLPILGSAPEVGGFLIATGHSGFSLGQITGKIITELITTGESSIPIDSFSVERFQEGRYSFPIESFRAYQRSETGESRVAAVGSL